MRSIEFMTADVACLQVLIDEKVHLVSTKLQAVCKQLVHCYYWLRTVYPKLVHRINRIVVYK